MQRVALERPDDDDGGEDGNGGSHEADAEHGRGGLVRVQIIGGGADIATEAENDGGGDALHGESEADDEAVDAKIHALAPRPDHRFVFVNHVRDEQVGEDEQAGQAEADDGSADHALKEIVRQEKKHH